jgi:hypothetical protein
MDLETRQEDIREVIAAAREVVCAYRGQRRSLYRTFGLDKLVKALDRLDDAAMLQESSSPAAPGQVPLDLLAPKGE